MKLALMVWLLALTANCHALDEVFVVSGSDVISGDDLTKVTVSGAKGATVMFTCDVRGLQGRPLYWLKEGVVSPLAIGEHIFSSNGRLGLSVTSLTTELSISNLVTSDSGTYMCVSVGKGVVEKFRILIN